MLAIGSRQPSPEQEQQNRDRVRELKRDKIWWQKNSQNDPPWFRDMKQRTLDKQIKYWSGNPGPPTGDGKSVDERKPASGERPPWLRDKKPREGPGE